MMLGILFISNDTGAFSGYISEMRHRGHSTSVASDSQTALDVIERSPFDAIVLDCGLIDADGIEVVERIRARMVTTPIVMLSINGISQDKIDGLNAGADDYLVRPVPTAELEARLAALVRGRSWSDRSGDTLRAGDITISPARIRAWRGETALDLAKLEFDLLAEFVRNAGDVLTRHMLLDRVWGSGSRPASNIVDVYVRRLREKLVAAGAGDPIATKRGVGYVLRADDGTGTRLPSRLDKAPPAKRRFAGGS